MEAKEYMTEEEILENFVVEEDDLKTLLAEDVVTSKIEDGRQVFAVEEIKIHFWEIRQQFDQII